MLSAVVFVQAAFVAAGLSVDLTNGTAVRLLFEEGNEELTTGGSIACCRSDHLRYNQTTTAGRGLEIRMDDVNATCAEEAQLSTGHLSSYDVFGFGDLLVEARVAHSPDGPPPPNAKTCFSLYTDEPVHNELALCFNAWTDDVGSFGYWVGTDGDVEHQTDVPVADAADAYHRYRVVWRPDYVAVLVDDAEVVHVDGAAVVNGTLPWIDMSIRVILRPRNADNSDYQGTALVDVVNLTYTPWAESLY